MYIKKPIYNQQLKCVAFEILSPQHTPLLESNINILQDLILNTDPHLPLFLPFAFQAELEALDVTLENPIILKLNAEDVGQTISLETVKESTFAIALLIDSPKHLTLINCADYIGLTEQLLNSADVTKVVQYCKSHQRKVMAYGIDKPMNFDKCKTMAMDYYCGDFLFKTTQGAECEVAANKLNLLQLIQSVQQEDCDFQEISNIIQSDPLLSFQMLKISNSVGFSGGQAIDSIDQAVARLGMINLKNWVTVLSMKNISDKPKEIMESGLVRAHMAQSLAKLSSNISPEVAYTSGLLSILDCLLNKPMTDLIEQITLSDEIRDALTTRSGEMGELLNLVVAYEAGRWEEIPAQKYDQYNLSQLYIESLNIASQGSSAMHN